MLVAVGSTLFLSGCSRPITGVAEQRIAGCLATYLGPAESWRVTVDGKPQDVLRGRFAKLTVVGRRVQVLGYLRCANIGLKMADVDFDIGRRRINSMGPAHFRLVLDEQDVLAYLRQGEDPRVARHMTGLRFESGRVRATGTYRWLRMSHPFDVTSVPEIRQSRIDYNPQRMSVHGVRVPLPAQVMRSVARRLGYGFDLGALPFPVVVDRLVIADRHATATGEARFREFLNDAMAPNPSPRKADATIQRGN